MTALEMSPALSLGALETPPRTGELRNAIPSGKGRIDTAEYLARVRRGQTCGMPSFLHLASVEHSRDWQRPAVCAVIGGGPSLADELPALRRLIARGAKTIAVNKSHDWLLQRNLPCHYAVLLDPKDWVAGYIDLDLAARKRAEALRAGKFDKAARARVADPLRWAETRFLIASQCHDDVIAKFKDQPHAYMWHAAAGLGESEILRGEFARAAWINVAGASVVGLRAVALAHGLGSREMHLFGIDGSMKRPGMGELKRIFAALVEAGHLVWTAQAAPTADEILEIVFTLTHERRKLPDAVNAILQRYLYSYGKPKIDATWRPFTVELKSGWTRPFMANHHMARSVYEFEDAMKDWDRQIKAGAMEPFAVRVHGNPETAAIAMVAAGMGVHAEGRENERYGAAPTL